MLIFLLGIHLSPNCLPSPRRSLNDVHSTTELLRNKRRLRNTFQPISGQHFPGDKREVTRLGLHAVLNSLIVNIFILLDTTQSLGYNNKFSFSMTSVSNLIVLI